MNRSERRRAKKLPRLGMCINCGYLAPTPGRPSNAAIICSSECEKQWKDLDDQLGDDDKALAALVRFTAKWPEASKDDFMHIVAISQRMEAKYPTVWPFLIEYHSDKGCWIYTRKDRKAEHVH